MKIPLRELASVIRSKNSGPYELTLDILFKDDENFRKVADSGCINKALIARLYRMDEDKVLSVLVLPAARAIKATIVRPMPSGALGERDVYGAQQHGPLMSLILDLED